MANEDAILKALQRAEAGLGADLGKVGVLWVNAVKVLLSQPGRGRLYRRGTVVHRASAPGDPPAVDTGAYRASWRHALTGATVVAMYPGPSPHPQELGMWLEFGTSKMQARPHVRPTNESMRETIYGVIATGIEKRQREF